MLFAFSIGRHHGAHPALMRSGAFRTSDFTQSAKAASIIPKLSPVCIKQTRQFINPSVAAPLQVYLLDGVCRR